MVPHRIQQVPRGFCKRKATKCLQYQWPPQSHQMSRKVWLKECSPWFTHVQMHILWGRWLKGLFQPNQTHESRRNNVQLAKLQIQAIQSPAKQWQAIADPTMPKSEQGGWEKNGMITFNPSIRITSNLEVYFWVCTDLKPNVKHPQ